MQLNDNRMTTECPGPASQCDMPKQASGSMFLSNVPNRLGVKTGFNPQQHKEKSVDPIYIFASNKF